MNINWAKDWISKQEFVYAKSYSETFPHYYTTKDKCNSNEFEIFINVIRNYGRVKRFYSKQYIYLELDNYEYWEMGRPIKAVKVLNKAIINDNAKYRFPIINIEEEFKLKETLAIREEFINTLEKKIYKTDKDIQILKFMYNSERRTEKERIAEIKQFGSVKNVIDHSSINIRYE